MTIRKEVCRIEHSFQDFRITEKLGQGGFASVYKAESCGESGCFEKFVAIKEIDKTDWKWKGHKKFVKSEIKIHQDSHHPNIVKLYHHLEDKKKIWLILELCSEGSLEDYLKKHESNAFNEGDAYKIFKQIVDGVMYLHSKHTVHRDLTLRNILLTKDKQVKIADFGLSTKLQEPNAKQFTVVGTPRYIAPEIKKNEGHSDKVDCWNLGCILYALLVGKPPKQNEEIHYPKNITPQAKELLKALLEEDPTKRICIEAVPGSKFFKEYEKSFPSKRDSYRSEDSDNGSNNYTKGKESRDSGINSIDSAVIRSRKKSHSVKKLQERPNFDLLPLQKNTFFSNSIRTRSRERSASNDRKPYIPLSYNNASQLYQNNTNGAYQSKSRDCYKSRERDENDDSYINSAWKTYYSFNPESIEACNDPSCKFNNSILERHLKVCPPTCSHVGNCENKCSHIGTCECHYHSCQKPHLSNCNNPEKLSECNLQKIPTLDAARLKPKRHWIKGLNTIVHISADRQVILEVLKIKKEKIYVYEVLTISTDGKEIKMYNPPKNTLVADDRPPPFPNDPKEIKFYNHSNFPYWKKYLIAKKFVDTLRAKTPKLINNGQNAKFYVMENYPDPDCRMDFYDGSSIIKKGKDISITDKHGKKCLESMSQSDIQGMLAEFECEKANCERILKFHESLPSPNFPIVIGMVKNDLYCSGIKAGKENLAPPASLTSKHKMRSNNR